MRSTVAGVGTSDSPPAAEVCGDSHLFRQKFTVDAVGRY